MIRVAQVSVPIMEEDQDGAVLRKTARILHCPDDGFRKLKIVRYSVDARDKDNICYSYTVDAKLRDTFTGPNAATERQYIGRLRNHNVSQIQYVPVQIPEVPEENRTFRPVIIGAGPCGLFAALTFAAAGLKPVIIERGEEAEERKKRTDLFFRTGRLCADSNIQFGEGGAGLFSDGKLNTSIKGKENYVRFVLETFTEFGAPEEILTDAKPHIGTDILEKVIRNMREFIEENGGTYYFGTRFTGFETENGRLKKALFEGKLDGLETSCLLLCQGHSARDTYRMLLEKGITLEKKAFAMGIRIQHPQKLIDGALYGENDLEKKQELLGPASYKLVHECENGRSVYSFCMCPGGYVINSSSEEDGLCVNGMSYSGRDSGRANSALVVNVTPEDFPGGVLAGTEFQQELERKARKLACGKIPYETFAEFEENAETPLGKGNFEPAFLGQAEPAPVSRILPEFIRESVTEGVHAFDRQIPGFADPGAIVAGIEARTSSPVRIVRNEEYETSQPGLYAAGEGAGYAGGITSAAVDGIRAALALMERFCKPLS